VEGLIKALGSHDSQDTRLSKQHNHEAKNQLWRWYHGSKLAEGDRRKKQGNALENYAFKSMGKKRRDIGPGKGGRHKRDRGTRRSQSIDKMIRN